MWRVLYETLLSGWETKIQIMRRMTFLAIDIGNTRLKWAMYDDHRPGAALLAGEALAHHEDQARQEAAARAAAREAARNAAAQDEEARA